MKLQMKREALEKIDRQANEMPAQGTPCLCIVRSRSRLRQAMWIWSNVGKYFRMNKALLVGA
jgi:hypothetical protein